MTYDPSLHLETLRARLRQTGYDGFLVPMADEYQSEYVPSSAQRICFLSGFTGSAGFIIVLHDTAVFFTDGRYALQGKQQLRGDLFQIYDSSDKTPSKWMEENIAAGSKIGYDAWLHTATEIENLRKILSRKKAELLPVDANPVDAIWTDRPPAPVTPVFAHALRYAGRDSADKRQAIANDLAQKNLSATIITDPASVAWLLNIRGNDVPNTPLPLSFAIIDSTAQVQWFVDIHKLTEGLGEHLGSDVSIQSIEHFLPALGRLASMPHPVRIDPDEASSRIVQHLKEANVRLDNGDDPCALPKACKNSIEVEGMRAAHQRDAVALIRFFCWMEKAQIDGTLTELSAEEKLSSFRGMHPLYRGPSFDTIAGVGGHGAIVHYRATPQTNRVLETGQIFLLDSGGQYLDGTTDVTRTVSLGIPSPEVRDRFTRVLKGHIALAAIRFPKGTTGGELDVLARQHLWAIGIDYNHGTGHGVGSYLGVHEGPQAISRRNKVALAPGMVISNEPGYYKAGEYGIRIENLQVVVSVPELETAERPMLGFESLTLVPIDRHLIDVDLLTSPERKWLNSYHARIRDTIRPRLDDEASQWLDVATAPI